MIQFYSNLDFEEIDAILLDGNYQKIEEIIDQSILVQTDKRLLLSSLQIKKIIQIFTYLESNNDCGTLNIHEIQIEISKIIDEICDNKTNINKESNEFKKIFEKAQHYLPKSPQTRSKKKEDVSTQLERYGSALKQTLDCLTAIPNSDVINTDAIRYLNCGFCSLDTEELIPTNQPLYLETSSYRLKVNIGKFWGIGIPDVAIPDELLKVLFDEKDYLDIDVVVSSFLGEIKEPTQKLKLPKNGDSEFIFFDLNFTSDQRHSIDIDLLLQGHLLQSKRIEVDVRVNLQDIPPKSAFPVQDSYITWTRSVSLNFNDLALIQESPRKLTIIAERDINYNRIGLRFMTHEGKDLDFQINNLNDSSLTKLLNVVRQKLDDTMKAYGGSLGSDETVLTKHLVKLADVGRKFYFSLLPKLANQQGRQTLNVDLQPETVIQVAPLSSALGVPWELLYERKIESPKFSLDEKGKEEFPINIKLCPTWKQHGLRPEDCPSYGTDEEETTVCPHSFWGYRYIIEQLPCKLEPHKPLPKNYLPLFIRNKLPLLINATINETLNRLHYHWEELQKLESEWQLKLIKTDSRQKFKEMIKSYKSNPADILYFYTHGGIDEIDNSPYLKIGNNETIQLIDLDAWNMKFDNHQPFIIINACDSADYSPENFENLLQFFCDRGAAGIIGTQCEVKEKLADKFIINFFHDFLQKKSAGEALFNSRHKLLREYLDPRGLAYSLFASADIKLAQSVSTK
ncbi:hypothetical protein CAL7716_105350 (plasmid) [Calothrix sp. PCC 7716]|nr:hypothetical protein CAL7716_105350 [Calothrix sp. PCC 7716]